MQNLTRIFIAIILFSSVLQSCKKEDSDVVIPVIDSTSPPSYFVNMEIDGVQNEYTKGLFNNGSVYFDTIDPYGYCIGVYFFQSSDEEDMIFNFRFFTDSSISLSDQLVGKKISNSFLTKPYGLIFFDDSYLDVSAVISAKDSTNRTESGIEVTEVTFKKKGTTFGNVPRNYSTYNIRGTFDALFLDDNQRYFRAKGEFYVPMSRLEI